MKMPPYPVKLNALELAAWTLQIGVVALLFRKPRRMHEDHTASLLVCAFVILLAWNWRLIYEFGLASSGFWYFVEDDPCRWLLSWGWSRTPFLMTWDGIWQGGTFYVHGAAMRLTRDPMMASKFVSAAYNLVPLLGLFLFTQGLYRSRTFSLVVVLFTAPLWLHLLISTGTMAEMPVVGFMLGGVGALLMSLHPASAHRNRLQLAAALAFAAATAFHVTAWMMLVPILLISLGYAVRNRCQDASGVRRWVVFALGSCSYCAFWLIGCWVKFGDPLHLFKNYAQFVVRDMGRLPLWDRVLTYPSAIAYTIWGIFPLVIYGLFQGSLRDTEEKHRIRWVLAGTAGALLILVVSAIRSNPNPHAYRSTVTLATLLIPIALAPVWPLVQQTFADVRQKRLNSAAMVSVLPLVLFALLWIGDNHQRTIREQRELNPLDSNALAVGAWLRQEIIRPQLLDLPQNGPPVRLWNPGPPWFRNLDISYATGFPGRLQEWTDATSPGLESMKSGQYLITAVKLDDSRLARQWVFGQYTVYRFHADP